MGIGDFYKGRKVFVSGHTGFKGSWLCLWLESLGASVTGYSLAPETTPNMFGLCRVGGGMRSLIGDVRDAGSVQRAIRRARPEIVFHLAAQPLVSASYEDPLWTLETNVLGTAHLLQACRDMDSVRAVVVVTTDKCYAQNGSVRVFREQDPLGGNDVYSASKACAEIVTSSFRRSFFDGSAGIATARAGNVVGGGDWALNRLIPDCMRGFTGRQKVLIRNPSAIRPWQHVLEAVHGYLVLGRKLALSAETFQGAWNFGPRRADMLPVRRVADMLVEFWGGGAGWSLQKEKMFHEEPCLMLDSRRARKLLGWQPVWDVRTTLRMTVDWYRAFAAGMQMRAVTLDQIGEYSRRCSAQADKSMQGVKRRS